MRREEILAKLRALRDITVKRHNFSQYGPSVKEAEDLFTRYFAIRDILRSEYPSLFADLPVRVVETWGDGKYIVRGSLVTLGFDLDYCIQLLQDAENLDTSVVSTNVFKKEGKRWFIAYEGKTLRPNDMKGLNYIAHLLRNREKQIHVLDLLDVVVQRDGDLRAAQYGTMVDQQLQEDGMAKSRGGAADEILDSQAREEYRQRLADLQADLDLAQRNNDPGNVKKIAEEIDFIKTELGRAYGISGPRKSWDIADTARKAVSRCIKTSIERIRKEHEALADHLHGSIKTGRSCSYSPEKPIPWLF